MFQSTHRTAAVNTTMGSVARIESADWDPRTAWLQPAFPLATSIQQQQQKRQKKQKKQNQHQRSELASSRASFSAQGSFLQLVVPLNESRAEHFYYVRVYAGKQKMLLTSHQMRRVDTGSHAWASMIAIAVQLL